MITKLFVGRPTLAAVVVALVLLGGFLAAISLREQQLPNVDLPLITITIFYPGASPAEMREGIVRPIEDELAGAPGLDHLQATIQQGYAAIMAQFSLKSRKTDDLVEVQRRLQAAQSRLPADLETPIIETVDPGEAAVISLAVASQSRAIGELSALIRNSITPAIEQVAGVGHVQAYGIVTPAVEVEVDPVKLDAHNLTINDVTTAIAANNVRLPGGILYGARRETAINIRGDIGGAKSVADLQIPSAPKPVRIADVAKVADAHAPERIYSYVNGQPNFLLNVQKATGASEVDTARGVIAALPGLEQQFPGVTFRIIDDRSTFTRQLLAGVARTLIEGIILVAIVTVFFLRSWRNAVAVLVAIPASLLATLMVMRLAHFSIDTISLLAMTLITGILVDDSIVVIENTERHREMGEPPALAALNGRLEIGLAAIVITLVDVVVFLPIAFLPGIPGKFLSEFALVVVVATLSSLLVSFTITPALAANWSLLARKQPFRPVDALARAFDRLRNWYASRALAWGLRQPAAVVGIALITLAGALALVPLKVVGFEFDPPQDTGEIFVHLNFPSGTPLATTQRAVRAIERRLDGISDMRSETAVAGAARSPVGSYIIDGAVGEIDLHLRDRRAHSTSYWVAQIQKIAQVAAPTGQPVTTPVTSALGANSQPVDYLVSDAAGDPAIPAQKVYAALRATPGASGVFRSSGALAPQLDVTFDRDEARRRNVSLSAAALAVRAAFGGVRATQFATANGPKDVQVIYPPAYQRDLNRLKDIHVRADSGEIVRIGDIARFRFLRSPPAIDEVDRQRVVHVTADVVPGASLSNVEAAFEKKLLALRLPPSVRVAPSTTGNQQNLTDTVNGMAVALATALVLVFLLMVALYNSYGAPFIIMFSVPVAVVGALGSLAVTRQTLNAFSLIGTVLLIGLVSKNGILLVDYANQLRARGLDLLAAIRESARTRFRPIMMTTVAMVFGMLPLALALDPAVVSRRSLGIVVIGGLISSLLLTLVLIPVMYVRLSPKRKKEGPP